MAEVRRATLSPTWIGLATLEAMQQIFVHFSRSQTVIQRKKAKELASNVEVEIGWTCCTRTRCLISFLMTILGQTNCTTLP